jgi:hypothetical protein
MVLKSEKNYRDENSCFKGLDVVPGGLGDGRGPFGEVL